VSRKNDLSVHKIVVDGVDFYDGKERGRGARSLAMTMPSGIDIPKLRARLKAVAGELGYYSDLRKKGRPSVAQLLLAIASGDVQCVRVPKDNPAVRVEYSDGRSGTGEAGD